MKKMLILVLALSVMFTVAGFAQDMSKDSGTAAPAAPLKNIKGTVKGNQVEWSFETEDAGKVVYKGKLEGASKIKGTVEYGSLGKGTFTAEKKN